MGLHLPHRHRCFASLFATLPLLLPRVFSIGFWLADLLSTSPRSAPPLLQPPTACVCPAPPSAAEGGEDGCGLLQAAAHPGHAHERGRAELPHARRGAAAAGGDGDRRAVRGTGGGKQWFLEPVMCCCGGLHCGHSVALHSGCMGLEWHGTVLCRASRRPLLLSTLYT